MARQERHSDSGERALSRAEDLGTAEIRTPPRLAARVWEATAQLSGEISSADSRSAAEKAIALYEQSDDQRGLYLALAHLAFSFRTPSPEADAAYGRMRSIERPEWPPALRLYATKVGGGLASGHGQIDAESAQYLMCRPVAMESNLHNVLFVPADGVLHVSNASHTAPAADRPYVRIDLRELLRSMNR